MAAQGADDAYLRVCLTDRFAGPETLGMLRERFPLLMELRGKSVEATGEASVLTVAQLGKMDETDILKKFFAELFDCAPTEAQMKLFRDALLAASGEEARG